jgi:hypothetical protein
MRVCTRCKKERDDSEFNANAHQKNGRQIWCRECTTEYNRRWYEANKEKHRKYVRDHDKRPKPTHTCKVCGRGEPEAIFYIRYEGARYYYRYICMDCDADRKKLFPRGSAQANKKKNKKSGDKQKKDRRDPRKRAKVIVADCKAADRKKNRTSDLTVDFVKSLIVNGCAYCGDSEIQIGLDRIDNSLGHLQSNVNPSCRRCNWIRRDMPYEAWLRFVPVMRQVAKEGLLGDWHAGPNKSPQFNEAQKSLFGCLAQEDEQQSFKLQDETSSVSAPTMAL